MSDHTLGQATKQELAVAENMQPRVEDFQYQCRDCGAMYCRRCDGVPAQCPKCKKHAYSHIEPTVYSVIPVPCIVLVREVMKQ